MKKIESLADIKLLVDTFYGKVNKNNILSLYFKSIEWETHLPHMYQFWEGIAFEKSEYSGNPMQAHVNVHQQNRLTPEAFNEWINLFNETLNENFEGEIKEKLWQRAQSIASVIQLKTIYAK